MSPYLSMHKQDGQSLTLIGSVGIYSESVVTVSTPILAVRGRKIHATL